MILLCNLDKVSRPDAIAKRIAEYYCPVLTELSSSASINKKRVKLITPDRIILTTVFYGDILAGFKFLAL
ncbi:hypothetical protein [Nostoc sp.]|uniref:hypothetical protein n=1 Tax=Nostoc sp. TaxID=1180 RepID=UPI002FF7D2A9